MSAIYDNWEKLVGAVLKKEELWQLFHEQSRSPSISSSSSGFSFSHLNSSLDADLPFPFSSPQWSASNHNRPDDLRDHSPVETLTPNKNVSFAPPRKRDLKIEVPKLRIEDRGFGTHCSEHRSNVSPSSKLNPRSGGGRSESHTKGNDDAKQDSYVLPLPPASKPDFPLPNSAVKLPLPPLLSPESVRSPVSPWKKGKLIGRGPLGDVYLGFNSEKGQMCVMKEFSLYSDGAESKQCARMLEKEIALLSRINHPNIVQYYGSETVADNLYIYYEYVSGGSISMLLQQYGRLGESAIRSYTQQILLGISYLHSKSIAHRDIKGTSVLVDPNGRVKLCNFALEKQITKQYRESWLMGSSYWMAPEVITNPNERKLAVDIWSLGCTIFEMATSRPPLSQYNEVIAMHKIANHKDLPTFPDHLSDVCKDFLRLCLQWNPMNRPTASQLLEHPFVKTLSPLGKQLSASPSSGHATATSTVKSEKRKVMYLKKPFWSDALKPAAPEAEQPSPVFELVKSLDKQRLYREVTLALRTGLREARAEFSFLRTRGLRSILKFLRSVAESDETINLFSHSQTIPELQVVPVLFQHSLKEVDDQIVTDLNHLFTVEPMEINGPSNDTEVALALRVLEGCCLLHCESTILAHQHKAITVLMNILSNRGVLERGACLDALIAIMLDSSSNQMDFEACNGIEEVALLIRDKQVEENLRLKCGEFLLLLIGHVNGRETPPMMTIHEDVRRFLGEKSASLIWAASQFGSTLDPEQRLTALHIQARRVLESIDLY